MMFCGYFLVSSCSRCTSLTADPKVVSESTDPVEAVQIMLDGGFRHLPVVENERAVGIVSIRDLAEWSIRSEQAQT